MARSVSNSEFEKMKFVTLDLDQEWIDTFGELEEGFSMCVWGKTGAGKTTLMLRFLKDLSNLGKVYYNSHEQGMVGSLQKQARKQGIFELPSSQWVWGNKDSVDEMDEKMEKNRAKYIVVDSRDSIQLTKHRFLKLIHKYPKKSIIVICWCSGDKANGKEGQGIAYMSDVKVYVHDHTTDVRSRFGATIPYEIFPKKKQSGQQLKLM